MISKIRKVNFIIIRKKKNLIKFLNFMFDFQNKIRVKLIKLNNILEIFYYFYDFILKK